MTQAHLEVTPEQLTKYCNAFQRRWKSVTAQSATDACGRSSIALRGVTLGNEEFYTSVPVDDVDISLNDRIAIVNVMARAIASAIKELNLATLPAAARYIKA